MSNTARQRVKNMAAWCIGAVSLQIVVTVALVWLPESAATHGTLFFGEFINVAGTLFGLIGYALAASVRPSTASAKRSLGAGALWVVAAMVSVYATLLVPESWFLPAYAVVCCVAGSWTYLLANTRSNYRWSEP